MDPKKARGIINAITKEVQKRLIGIEPAIERSIMALYTLVPFTSYKEEKTYGQAHIILIDEPGRGKTDLMRTLASTIGARSGLILGHPEMMTGEIIGTEVNKGAGKFFLRKGPIFNHILLYDEISRTHPKGQASFLQAMEERLVVLEKTDVEKGEMRNVVFPLLPLDPDSDDPDQELFFWVMATANPVEQEGTYGLPEAQLDRFTISFQIGLPPRYKEKQVRSENLVSKDKEQRKIHQICDLETVLEISNMIVDIVETSETANEYIMRLVENSRPFNQERKFGSDELYRFVDENVLAPEKSAAGKRGCGGLSTRANIHFQAIARTHAFFRGRSFISVEDINAMAHPVMDHRILLKPEAIGGEITKHQVAQKIVEGTEVPP